MEIEKGLHRRDLKISKASILSMLDFGQQRWIRMKISSVKGLYQFPDVDFEFPYEVRNFIIGAGT